MKDKDTLTSLSKFLSLVLRHKPETIGISLSKEGWIETDTLMQKMNEFGKVIDAETLAELVATNSKKRFSFNEDKSKIRANQGHSVRVDLGYSQKTPPELLYHGTADRNMESIFKRGLEKRSRQHVHLSRDVETACNVGKRHGKPIVLYVDAKKMSDDGFSFYESENKVWLTEHVPVRYIHKTETSN